MNIHVSYVNKDLELWLLLYLYNINPFITFSFKEEYIYMKKIIIVFIVLLSLFGCKNEQIQKPVEPEDRIWLVFDYNAIDYNTYYKQQIDYTGDQELIRIKQLMKSIVLPMELT